MKRVASLLSNSVLTTVLLIMILGPIGIVARIGGTTPLPQNGTALGAKVNSLGEVLSEAQKGEIKEVAFTTLWGQTTVYRYALEIENTHRTSKDYRLEMLEISGVYAKKLEARIFFHKNGLTQLTLKPGERAWIDLEITAPPTSSRKQSGATLRLAIWEK